MKKIYLFSFIFLVTIVSCQNKQSEIKQAQLDTLNVELSETQLSNKADSMDLTNIARQTEKEYTDLQLFNVKGLEGYSAEDLSMGRILLANDNGKILSVLVITDCEITEYLLCYDKSGNLQDNLLVAYEDMVEYYSEVSTKINSKEIIVQTINFTYSDSDDDQVEKSDTAFVKYQITPEFKFIAN